MRTGLAKLVVSLVALGFAGAAMAAGPFSLSYMGRMADATTDKAVEGPVDIDVKFFRKQTGGTAIGVSPVTFSAVKLVDGVFQVDISNSKLSEEELHEVFASNAITWVEVKDVTHNVVYPRQTLMAVPFALKVPVDGKTIGYTDKGELTIKAGTPSDGDVLTAGAGGVLSWEAPSGGAAATSILSKSFAVDTPANGEVLKYNSTTQTWSAEADKGIEKTGDTGVGSLALAATKTLGLGAMTNAQEAALGFTAGDKGKTWYNSDSNEMKVWNGSTAVALGAAGGGLTSFNGSSASSHSLTVIGTAGTAPAWTTNTGTGAHTLDIPLASAAGVSAGLISKADYDAFNGKQAAIGTGDTLELGLLKAVTGVQVKGSTNYVSIQALGGTSAYTLTLPTDDGLTNEVLTTNGSGVLSWTNPLSGLGTIGIGSGGTGATTASGARTNLGLVIGTDVQAYDAGLQSLAGLTTAADQMVYTTAADTYAVSGLTASGRAILDDTSAADQRTTLGLGTLATQSASSVAITGGTVAVSGGAQTSPGLSIDGDANTGIYSPGADRLSITTAGTERLSVYNNGNVGIGTNAPTSILHLYGNGAPVIQTMQAQDGSTVELDLVNSGTSWGVIMDGLDANKFKIANAGVPKITVTTAGNLGIGTSGPVSKLHIKETGAVDTFVEVEGTQANMKSGVKLTTAGDDFGIFNDPASNKIMFHDIDAGVARIQIDNTSGKVGIGTAPTSNTLEVSGALGAGSVNTAAVTAGTLNVTGNTVVTGNTAVNGTTTLGSGSAITAAGVCTVGSIVVSNTPSNLSCAGIPASGVAVFCSPSAALSPASAVVGCRPSGTASQVTCTASATQSTSVSYNCMWMK